VMLAAITSGFPRRSETFVLNELLALESRGLLGPIFATKPGDASGLQPGAERLLPRVRVLPAVSPSRQARLVARALAGTDVDGVHAFFAHTPAEVGREAAARIGVPFGFSLHARDARKVRPSELRARAASAACVVACNRDVAEEARAAGAEAQVLPHGVDLRRFRPTPEPPEAPFTLLAVGRLVPKKGFGVLVEAAARLCRPLRLRIVGGGPERERLAAGIQAAGVADQVSLEPPVTHDELPAALAGAHVVAVPSVRDSTGDRDGLPNVVLEAMAAGRVVVASDVGAVGTAVKDGQTGLLALAGDAAYLAMAIERLAAHPALRAQLANAARDLVEREFDLHACTTRFAGSLEAAYA